MKPSETQAATFGETRPELASSFVRADSMGMYNVWNRIYKKIDYQATIIKTQQDQISKLNDVCILLASEIDKLKGDK